MSRDESTRRQFLHPSALGPAARAAAGMLGSTARGANELLKRVGRSPWQIPEEV